jgi:DNA-binding MarR family transcriptional regulator
VVPAKDDVPELAAHLRSVTGRLSRRLRRTEAGADLSPSQHEVLVSIVRGGPLRPSDVAAIEGLNPTMLSRIAGKLEVAGLVRRSQDAADGRVALLEATDQGRELVDRIRRERTGALITALDELDERARSLLARALPVLDALAESVKDRSG